MEENLLQLSVFLGERLKVKGLILTCAESCTGGLIAKLITDVAGSSRYFERGFVTYSNRAKHEMLGVSESTLQQEGAVSSAVVSEMARGALKMASADLALSVSGVAGPGGGSALNPVGTVWFGFASTQGDALTVAQYFPGNRCQIRIAAAEFALRTMIEKFL